MLSHPCSPAPARPNTVIHFQLYDESKPPLRGSPSPLNPEAWSTLLRQYPGDLPTHIAKVLKFGALIGYTGPEDLVLSKNLSSAAIHPEVLEKTIWQDLQLHRIEPTTPTFPLISSPLGLVPKPGGAWRKIHHLSFPEGQSVNDHISQEAAYLRYVSFEEVLQMVRNAGRGCWILRRDMKDAFRVIPIAPHQRWLLAFEWAGQYYRECVLPFGLATAPFIFNIFAEAWHWILESFLGWRFVEHYLDDTMAAIMAVDATPHALAKVTADYKLLTDIVGILRNDGKDEDGTEVTLLGRRVNSITCIVSVPQEKLDRIIQLTAEAIDRGSLTLLQTQSLAGLLSFCASCVQLGFVFCRRIWTFIASFQTHWAPSARRRIPAAVLEDLHWWNKLLPMHNGTRFFDDEKRDIIHLFADASIHGLGAFFLDHLNSTNCDWKLHIQNLPKENALAIPLPPSTREDTFDINIYEISAILQAFNWWCASWRKKRVIIHTDNSTTQLGIEKGTLRSPAQNEPLRQIFLRAAQFDVVVQAVHLPGKDNELADALSRNLPTHVANWCPQWQVSSRSLHLPQNGLIISMTFPNQLSNSYTTG
jgi:Reverse transcriptase (RNA-dependent DNA polymerase)